MSLSKYYKDSSSFKREEIVQSNTPEPTGWQSKETAPATPFKAGGMDTRRDEKAQTAPNTPAVNKATEPPPPVPPVTTNQKQKADAKPAEPSIDLSKYVSIEEAEEKAQAMFQQGVNEGIEKTTEDFGSAIKTLTAISEQLDTIRETIIANSSKELTEFTILIAEKIIRTSIKEQDQTIIATIQEALSRAVKSDEFTIFIHPDDYQAIADKSEDLIAGVSGLSNIVLKTDPLIEQGGAKIESDNCIIDATLTSQFDAIRDEIITSKE